MKKILTVRVFFVLFFSCGLLYPLKGTAQSSLPINAAGMNMPSRVPVKTMAASSLDFTRNQDYTGNISLPIPLVSLGGANVQLKYYNKDIANQFRTENRYAPSGSFGLGWQMLYGSISGEINGSADTTDDKYFYNGPDGSFELIEGADGTFRIPNYRPWKIQRYVSAGIITGWTITKEDGTILRFGNYYRASGGYNFSATLDSTFATRCFIGYNGLVSNPDANLYSNSLTEIPYQWDLSNIQDISGNVTSLTYTQTDVPLTSGSSSTATYYKYYTRESHLYVINDNNGNTIVFNYAGMNFAGEYYSDYSSWTQNLFESQYLSYVQIQRNSQTYKQIVCSYLQSSTFGTTKRFLTA